MNVIEDSRIRVVRSLLTTTVTYKQAWIIERKSSRRTPWEMSVIFPVDMTYSAIDFFVHERKRIQEQRLGYEGMRLIMVVGDKRINVAGIIAGPSRGRKGVFS